MTNESLPKIKFSHEYWKFPRPLPFEAVLIQVLVTNKKNLSQPFIEYDTKHTTGYYMLPDGVFLLLLLTDDTGKLFTTVRSFNKKKSDYYNSLVGKKVMICKG